jgi:hypothetical protein
MPKRFACHLFAPSKKFTNMNERRNDNRGQFVHDKQRPKYHDRKVAYPFHFATDFADVTISNARTHYVKHYEPHNYLRLSLRAARDFSFTAISSSVKGCSTGSTIFV